MATYISIETDKKISYQIDGGDKQTMFANIDDDGYPEPTGTITITENGTGIDVKDYALANVNVIPTNIISGTFTGTGEKSVTLSCEKVPDVILVQRNNLSDTVSGIVYEILQKNIALQWCGCDAQSTATTKYSRYAKSFYDGLSETGYNNPDSPGTRNAYVTFGDNSLTIDHNTGSLTIGMYDANSTFTYHFIYL